ncbi:MAG: ABC transporter ATP-binding protein, partial [Christensenellales bacterium]
IASGEKAPPRAGDVAVEFRHVNLRYAGAGANALTDIDFIARAGETIGIIGGTGAGKSSLVHMIPRFYDAAEGSVRVDGMDVRDYPVESLRERIGFVPQKAVLFKGSVRENMRWGRRDATDAEIWDALAAAQARGFVEDKGGLDAPVEQGGRNFSGGQRQRLTIARALVRNPRILILDDSASALDFATDLALRRSIRALESKPTVFIVSQRASAVKHADNIIVLEGGGIVGMGKSDALLRDCAVYREIYHSQYRKEDAADG